MTDTLTREMVLAMGAEELRRAIAKKKYGSWVHSFDGLHGPGHEPVPNWTGDIRDAWELFEEMVTGHADPGISHGWNLGSYDCNTITPNIHTNEETAPMAISRCWLLWKLGL